MPKDIRLSATYYVIMKIPNKREFQQIASNHLCDTEFKDLMKPYKNYNKEQFSVLANNTTLPSDNPLRFRKEPL